MAETDTGTEVETPGQSTSNTPGTETGTEAAASAGGTGTDDLPPEVRKALTKANKEAESLRLKLKEFEDRDKTEAQKTLERAEAAEKRATELERHVLVSRIASEEDVIPEVLSGTTEDELRASAKRIKEWRDQGRKPAPKVGALKSGSSKTTSPADAKEAAANAMRRLSGSAN